MPKVTDQKGPALPSGASLPAEWVSGLAGVAAASGSPPGRLYALRSLAQLLWATVLVSESSWGICSNSAWVDRTLRVTHTSNQAASSLRSAGSRGFVLFTLALKQKYSQPQHPILIIYVLIVNLSDK